MSWATSMRTPNCWKKEREMAKIDWDALIGKMVCITIKVITGYD